MSLSLIKYPSGGGGESLRFGVAGEDDLAAEVREFSTGVNDFAITDSPDYDSYIAFWTGQDVDLYSSNPLDSNMWTEIYMQPDTLGVYLGSSSILEIEGLQSGTAVSTLGLDSNNRVVLSSSLSSFSNTGETFNTGGLVPSVELAIPDVAAGRYHIQGIVLFNLAIAATGVNFQLIYSGSIVNVRSFYKAMNNGTTTGGYEYYEQSAFGFPIVTPVGALDATGEEGGVKIDGYLQVSNAGTFNIQVEATGGNFASISAGSFLKLEKID